MGHPFGFPWHLVVDVRRRERSRFLFFAGLAALVSAAQTLGLVGSEALFLSRFGAVRLPEAFIAAASVTVVGTFGYATAVGRLRNDGLFLQMALGSAVLLVGAAWVADASPDLVLPALFCFYYLSQAIFMNHFFTFAGDYFDTASSKRLFPRFTIAASLGSAVGAGLAVAVARFSDPLLLIGAWGAGLGVGALLLRLGRRPLRRWGPLELEEADETSVEGMQGAVRFLRATSLGRTLALSAAGMVLALFVAQYLYSGVFVERFREPSRLATFLGLYLLITNAVEIVIGFGLTPRLIRRLGVPSANLVHPVLSLLSFVGLGFQYGYASAVAARVNREMVDNSMGFPIRSLVINALPLRFRGRVRAFLEGVVVYVGMAAAGLLLLVLGDPDPQLLCLAGGAAALVFLAANVRVRREYVLALDGAMRRGQLDIEEVSDELGRWEASRLADLWEALLADTEGGAMEPLLKLVPSLAARGIHAPLVRAASHPNPGVRRACLEALATHARDETGGTLALALDDPDAEVRITALRGLAALQSAESFLAPRLRELVSDPDPRVRAEAALQTGDKGLAALAAQIGSDDPLAATSALRVAPAELLHAVLRRVHDTHPGVRSAALERTAVISERAPLSGDALGELLQDPDARVRRAGAILVATFPGGDAAARLADALADIAPPVRLECQRALCAMGDAGVAAVRPLLRCERERLIEAALPILAAAPGASQELGRELHWRVRELWIDVVAHQHLPRGEDLASRFLLVAYRDAIARHERLTFKILEFLVGAPLIRRVERALRFGSPRARGDALEVLSNLGDRGSASLLALLHEAGPLDERTAQASKLLELPADTAQVLERSRRSQSHWIRLAANALFDDDFEPREVDVMERLLALRRVPLFATLSLEQLEALQRIAKEVEYLRGEIICREGEPGSELFVVMDGDVRIVKSHGEPDETPLTLYRAGGYFGEMAIFGGERRTATARAEETSRVLSIDGRSLKELILQMPEISFEIFRELTQRVRKAEERSTQR